MPRWPDDDEDDDPDDGDLPDGVYHDDPPTVPCPHCRRDILEDVATCPYCGQSPSAEDAPTQPKSWFWAVMMAAALAVAALWVT